MTFREKLKEQHPENIDERCGGGCIGCPSYYGYEENYDCKGVTCKDCWNREMPNTEPKEDGIPVIPQSEIDSYNKVHEDGVAQGLNDAWELARKIFTFNCNEMNNIFGFREKRYVFDELDVQEALAKLKAYEEAQSKIEVGDVCESMGTYALIIRIDDDGAYVNGIKENGGTVRWIKKGLKKTGKHIDISSILEQIG